MYDYCRCERARITVIRDDGPFELDIRSHSLHNLPAMGGAWAALLLIAACQAHDGVSSYGQVAASGSEEEQRCTARRPVG